MSSLIERQAQAEIPRLLERLVGAPATVEHFRSSRAGPDLIVKVGKFTFVVEVRGSGDIASVWRATQVLHDQIVPGAGSTLPIVAVPYMGEPGRAFCEQEGIGWLDLSGNAHLTAPGLRVHVDGCPNQFKRRGRPANVFAPKSARISRRLLLEPEQFWSQRELARAAGVNEGLTSRVVRKLEEEGLLERKSSGEVRPGEPGLLLDAWRETYDFEKHEIIRGHVLARSGAELLRRLANGLEQQGIHYAMTGLGAAWLATRFANFLTATAYLREPPGEELMEALGFRREERGANVWLVVPADVGVLDGEQDLEGIRCVSTVQMYLDLKGHPERSKEAAEHLRRELLAILRETTRIGSRRQPQADLGIPQFAWSGFLTLLPWAVWVLGQRSRAGGAGVGARGSRSAAAAACSSAHHPSRPGEHRRSVGSPATGPAPRAPRTIGRSR